MNRKKTDTPFLCLTAQPEFWDTSASQLYFLGPWCRRFDRPQDWKGLKYTILPHPFADRSAWRQAAAFQEATALELLAPLAAFLNDAHGLDRPLSYWKMIVWPWLWAFVTVVHERYACLHNAFARIPGLETTVLGENAGRIPPTSAHFRTDICDDPVNLQVYSGLLRALGRCQNTFAGNRPFAVAPSTQLDEPRSLAARPLDALRRRMLRYWASNARVLMSDIYFSAWPLLAIMAGTAFQARLRVFPSFRQAIDPDEAACSVAARNKLATVLHSGQSEFHQIVGKVLSQCMPLSFLEHFPEALRWVRRHLQNGRTKALVTGAGFVSNDLLRIFAAELHLGGGKVVSVQHGGLYGSAVLYPNETIETRLADQFWSWGWTDAERPITPVASPRLSLYQQRRKTRERQEPTILFVGNLIYRYHLNALSLPPAFLCEPHYYELQPRFFNALNDRARQDLLIRLYPEDMGIGQRRRIEEVCPWARFQNPKADYRRSILDAALLVTDINTTTILDALAADIPLVAYWEPAFSEVRPEAAPYYQSLRAVGILHDTPESAAEAINGIYPDTGRWWNHPDTRAVRKAFTDKFARTSRFWIPEWIQRLHTLHRKPKGK